MPLEQAAIPRIAPRRFRPPKPGIPPALAERRRVLQAVRNYVAEFNPVPPLPLAEVAAHASRVVTALQCDPSWRDYIGVLVNNEMWRESLAAVPFERRLLLLPKCLRDDARCPAPFDEFGLLCKQCGLCSINDLQSEAERLGYAVLVAEGSAVVMSLIQAHKIEAVVGVSCLGVLERAFPFMEAAAIPGVAIPLLQDDCVNTTVDLDWVRDYLYLSSDDQTRRLDLEALRHEVDRWFEPESLERILGESADPTERLARQWLARGGKRWRPFLTVAAYRALAPEARESFSDDLKRVAVAVECFHKASLVHDDIEDGDTRRYGEKTLHEEYGVPVALNVGDLLIGEGYRLLASTQLCAEQKLAAVRIASEMQRRLCCGQGAELSWLRSPVSLSQENVLEIFRLKTAPAFAVALHLGALFAGIEVHEAVGASLTAYSDALGIAYQIRDDIDDFDAAEDGDRERLRPSLVAAVAMDRTRLLLESYKEASVRSLAELENPNLKGMLRRVIGKIFNETEIDGWCREVAAERGVAPWKAQD